jgi:hypothetical protein
MYLKKIVHQVGHCLKTFTKKEVQRNIKNRSKYTAMLNVIRTYGQVKLKFYALKFKTRPLFSQRSIFICLLDGRLCGPRLGLVRGDREESVAPFGNQTQANSLSLSRFNTCFLLRNVFSAFLNKFIACKFCFSKFRL